MKEQEKTKEQLKQEKLIFEIFSKWRDSTNPTETEEYCDQFCEQINNWYKKYYNNAYNMHKRELTIVINKITNKNRKLNIPKDKEGFIKYFSRALKNEKINTFRKCNEGKSLYIPKNVNSRLKKLNKFIASEENRLGRKLTGEEKIQCATTKTKLFRKQVYMNLLKINKISGIHLSKGTGKIALDDDYLSKNNIAELKEAVKYLLAKKQKRARDCCKALFTIYCIKKDLSDLYPILDQKILDSFHREGKKQKQYEIYIKYHPKVTKKSAEAQASTNLHIFLNDIKTCLKERKNK
jgi:hypothetical protein